VSTPRGPNRKDPSTALEEELQVLLKELTSALKEFSTELTEL